MIHGTWHIRPEARLQEREKSNAGSLRLPEQALAIAEAQPVIFGNPHVFAGRGKGPFNSWSQCKEELDAKILEERRKHDKNANPLPHWTIHHLRRTARSLMSRAGVRPDIAERVLGHAIAGVEGVYDRHAYDDERRLRSRHWRRSWSGSSTRLQTMSWLYDRTAVND